MLHGSLCTKVLELVTMVERLDIMLSFPLTMVDSSSFLDKGRRGLQSLIDLKTEVMQHTLEHIASLAPHPPLVTITSWPVK